MATQLTLTTTTQTTTTGLSQDQQLSLQALSLTEAMNNEALTEMNRTLETTNALVANLQRNLEAVVLENGLLKTRIIQQEIINSENTRLHTKEMRTNTQLITNLSQLINTLTDDLRLTNRTLQLTTAKTDTLEKNLGTLLNCYNSHGHESSSLGITGAGTIIGSTGGVTKPCQFQETKPNANSFASIASECKQQ